MSSECLVHVVSKENIKDHVVVSVSSSSLPQLQNDHVLVHTIIISLTVNAQTYARLGSVSNWWDTIKLVEDNAKATRDTLRSVEIDLRKLLTSKVIRETLEKGAFAEPIFAAHMTPSGHAKTRAKPWSSNKRKEGDFAAVHQKLAQVMATIMLQCDCRDQEEHLDGAESTLENVKIVTDCHQCTSKSNMGYNTNKALR